MQKITFIATIALALLSGCQDDSPLEGTLSVHQEIFLKAQDNQLLHYPPGEYPALVKFLPGSLILSPEGDRGHRFTLPDNSSPPENGVFTVLARDSGQPYDLRAEVSTRTYQDGEPYTIMEPCPPRSGEFNPNYRRVSVVDMVKVGLYRLALQDPHSKESLAELRLEKRVKMPSQFIDSGFCF